MKNDQKIADLREEYTQARLDPEDLASEPIAQFEKWFAEAQNAGLKEPNAMHLSTVSAQGQPAGRIVLLKGLDQRGFHFYTNYNSQKGQDLAQQAQAALTFFWVDLERQVRIEGRVEKLSEEESTKYFHSRPRSSQLGAWTSPQSEVIENRGVLESNFQALEAKYAEGAIPKPPHWGGYCLSPQKVEFWQGRPSRLHDRMEYRKEKDLWKTYRLAP